MQEIFLVSTTLVRYHVTVQSVGMVDPAQGTDCICGFSLKIHGGRDDRFKSNYTGDADSVGSVGSGCGVGVEGCELWLVV